MPNDTKDIQNFGAAFELVKILRQAIKKLVDEEFKHRIRVAQTFGTIKEEFRVRAKQEEVDKRLARDEPPGIFVDPRIARRIAEEFNAVLEQKGFAFRLNPVALASDKELGGIFDKMRDILLQSVEPKPGEDQNIERIEDPFPFMERANADGSLDQAFADASAEADGLSAAIDGVVAAMAGMNAETRALAGGEGDGSDGLSGTIETVRAGFAGLGDEAVAAGRDMAGAFEDAGIGAVDFKGFLGDIFDALGGLGGKAGELIGLFGRLFRGGGLSDLLGGLGGLLGFAGGGTVQPRLPAIVGERGPELFIPSAPGRIANASETRALLGAPAVTVNQSITLATDVRSTVRAEIANAAPLIAEATRRGLIDDFIRRGIL